MSVDSFSLVVILIVVFTLGYTVGRSDRFFGVEKKKKNF